MYARPIRAVRRTGRRLPPRLAVRAAGSIPSSGTTSFSDTFSSAQNPISSPWTKTSSVNQVVIVTGGIATNNTNNSNNDDAYAWISTASFQAPSDNYLIEATWASPGASSMETELLARVTDTSSTYSCYELLINSGGYEIVQINGGFGGNFVEFNGANGTPNTVGTIGSWSGAGDKVRFQVSGTNPVRLQMWHAPAATPTTFTQYLDVNDSSANRKTSGQPGIGFYAASPATPGDKGWTDYSVTAV